MSEIAQQIGSLYVGCGLTGAPEAFIEEVEALKTRLKEDYEVYDFVGLTDGTNEDVYNWDINNCVANCDMLVGICDYPSIGLGWEMSKAIQLGTPTLGVAHASSRVTRLVLGAASVERDFSFSRYEDMMRDVPRFILQKTLEVG